MRHYILYYLVIDKVIFMAIIATWLFSPLMLAHLAVDHKLAKSTEYCKVIKTLVFTSVLEKLDRSSLLLLTGQRWSGRTSAITFLPILKFDEDTTKYADQ